MDPAKEKESEGSPSSDDEEKPRPPIRRAQSPTPSQRQSCLSETEKARLLDQAVKDICEADFVAIDLEFTGLFPQALSASSKRPPSLSSYYELCIQGAEFFLAPQLGICTARRCPPAGASASASSASTPAGGSDGGRSTASNEKTCAGDSCGASEKPECCQESQPSGKWILAPYTFHAFPSQRTQGGVDTCTLKWLLQNGFDFNQWISTGFNYMRLAELQQQARQVANSPASQRRGSAAGKAGGPSGSSTDEGVAEGTYGRASRDNGGRTQHADCEARGDASAADSLGPQLSGGLEVTGLQRLIEAIVENEKPLVVHNGHLDLLHVFDKFIGKAPDTLREFCVELLRLFTGGIYDTKHLANEGKTFVLKIGDPRTTSLLALRHHLVRSESLCVFEIALHRRGDFNLTFQQLNCDNGPECGRSHEAGYDALLTAQTFVLELDLYAQHYSLAERDTSGTDEGAEQLDDDLWALEESRPAKKRRKKRKNRPRRQPIPIDWNKHRWYAPFRNHIGVSGVRPGYIDLSTAGQELEDADSVLLSAQK
ncbi:CAF1 family ribonuclease [Besnoitia besnoiti]|uniref:CAF1 family ribonuclease n=1 Tax=Besnoitia besnoiti TaxID=94643 RepID=A0A2A9MI47_BESBE|nr:CAF1 family ribonuclease [Besnoitia besnoiti]PFH37655.1 CAF1 family ribonuclease [Besnoitia besnoiti]